MHQIQKKLVQSFGECVSIYQVLDVSSIVVLNYLIDSKQIERALLMPDTDTAIRLMSSLQNVPCNCLCGLTIKGDLYYPYPKYRRYGSQYHSARFLQGDSKIMIR